MAQINILSKEVYQLIAAGEVVERPSSVVKEMIENSVDAGAKNITVEIKNGGSTYIRITDDGCGISREDVKKVFVSHATSKIKESDDLDRIATLGFRGEAMASISAVARVQLLTRTPDAEIGTRYEIAGGQELEIADAGCPVGTTIVVADLFYNTPARMKFLKKDVTEANAVAGVVERIAVSHPEISFRFIRDGKQALVTSGNGDLKSTVYSVFGRDFAQSLVPVDYEINNMRVSGFVTKPSMSRKSRGMQFFFINSRLVKSQTAMAALEQAYRNSIIVGRFPGCVLNIECNTSFVDVNVHPAKIEVRFANEKPVFELVYYGVKNAIEMLDTPKEASFSSSRPVQTTVNGRIDFFKPQQDNVTQMQFKQEQSADDFWRVASTSPVSKKPEYDEGFDNGAQKTARLDLEKITRPTAEEKVENEPKAVESLPKKDSVQEVDIPDFRLVGEIFKTYIIIEMDGDCYMIDKHAAHERMNYEALKASTQIASQVLLTPEAVRLSREEYNAVISNLDLYSKCGFLIEDFGNSTVLVRECPSILDGEDVAGLVQETSAKLLEGKTDITPEQMDWIFHSTSCRAAVKAGDKTSPYEMELFVKKLLANPNIRYCPHGRPVMIKLSKYDIEKQFGRIQ
ncbi:DNA mismatch repair endonuclease MutL [uncultured Eubacterium sp.]|uniref:DNA mismatch repair endonuclease MutL n=1 Tax=uncultured Eubacterium sp. TaxID=165185 RepID=UPI0025EC4B62|nr:DNA mismatch repair endonuclease MutL [uncultured Eubacterium sp.]